MHTLYIIHYKVTVAGIDISKCTCIRGKVPTAGVERHKCAHICDKVPMAGEIRDKGCRCLLKILPFPSEMKSFHRGNLSFSRNLGKRRVYGKVVYTSLKMYPQYADREIVRVWVLLYNEHVRYLKGEKSQSIRGILKRLVKGSGTYICSDFSCKK